MHGEGFFLQAFVYLTAAVVSVPVAKRLGLGSVLGYLIAGIAIGPFGLKLVGAEGQDVMHFAEFGVVMMLFVVGLELRPSLLWQLRGPILGLGGLQVVVTTLIGLGIGMAFHLSWQEALSCGLILALSSTAIVLQTLNEKGLMKTDAGQSSFAVLLFQDIAVIPILALLPFLATVDLHAPATAIADDGHHGDAGHAAASTLWIEGLPAWGQALVILGVVAGIIVAGRFLVRPLFRFIASSGLREIFTAAALLLVIGIALLMTRCGLSPALGTFLAGVVLTDSEYRHELESDIEPFKGLLLGLFFIAVGASVDFQLIANSPALIAGLVVLLIAVKFIVLFTLSRVFKMGLDQGLLFSFALAQGGEFAFVLFSFATQNGVLTNAIAAPLIAVVAVTMAATPLLMLINERLIQPRVGTVEADKRAPDTVDEENPVLIAGFGRFGHIVGRFLSANGVQATILDTDSDHIDLLRKLGIKAFYGDASRLDLLHAAGAQQAKVLVVAVDDPEKITDIVNVAKVNFPHLRILARAFGRAHAYELLDCGIRSIYRETLDTSLRMGVDLLRELGYPAHQAVRAARKFRKHDEESVIELATMREDRVAYVNRAREMIRSLEEILLRDAAMPIAPPETDSAWDTQSIREEFGKSTNP